MLEYQGKFTSCKVFTDDIEEEAVQQIYNFLNCPAFEGATIRVMPDVHAGAGAVIGFTSTLTDKIIPNVVGVDIGCGVTTCNLGKIDIDFAKLDSYIRENVPFGCNVRDKPYKWMETVYVQYIKTSDTFEQFEGKVESVCTLINSSFVRNMKAIGTLGPGNHFLEVGYDGEDYWLTVHSGSRRFGLDVATYHQKKAIASIGKRQDKLEWLEGNAAALYLEHMKVAQDYAKLNRYVMLYDIIEGFFGQKMKKFHMVESVHNYINFEDKTVRKGAISAHKGEQVIIPWNMKDGLIIGIGKGNTDWNYSAPHGGGRKLSRRKAKDSLSLDKFRESMSGVWTSCVDAKTLDESPMAYKDPTAILELIKDTVDVKFNVVPVYNFKAFE